MIGNWISDALGNVLGTATGFTGAPPVGFGALDGLVDAVASTVSDVLPFALGIMAILLGVSLIPRLIYKFL